MISSAKEYRLKRLLFRVERPVSIKTYALLMRRVGLTIDEAMDRLEELAYRDGEWARLNNALDIVYEEYLKPRKVVKRRVMIGKHTKAEWENCKMIHGHRCFYCGKISNKLSKDHVIPVAFGGSNTIDNIVPACMDCNRRKGTKLYPF